MRLRPESGVLLVRQQLAEAEDGQSPPRPASGWRAVAGGSHEERAVPLRPALPVRLAMTTGERRVHLVALQPRGMMPRELLQPLAQRSVARDPRPRRPQQPSRRFIRVRVRSAQQRPFWPPCDRFAQLAALEQPRFDQRLEGKRGRAAAEQRRVVRGGVERRRLPLRPELQPVKAELRREFQESVSALRERRSAAEVFRGISGKREVVDREQQPLDAQRPQRLADELAQRPTPPGPARRCRAEAR